MTTEAVTEAGPCPKAGALPFTKSVMNVCVLARIAFSCAAVRCFAATALSSWLFVVATIAATRPAEVLPFAFAI